MTSDIATVPAYRPTSTSSTVGQATAIEQSRAVAEVQAAVVAAKHTPRDTMTAVEAMREACQQPALASRAFFRYSRAGSQITGASIHLARELARVWGNVQYGIHELRRDDDDGESEMQAFAWDLQTNTRTASTFVVPHARDTRERGRVALTELRDIYENNANQGARRVREAIFAVLPSWFVDEAKALCLKTIEEGGGKPLAQRVVDAIAWFESAGVRLVQLEDKLGSKRDAWRAIDVAQLEVIARSLRTGETTIGDEFPKARLSDDDFDEGPAKSKRKRKQKSKESLPPEPTSNLDQDFDEPTDADGGTKGGPATTNPAGETGEVMNDAQNAKMSKLFTEYGMPDGRTKDGRAQRIAYVSRVLEIDADPGTPLTFPQAEKVIEALIADLDARDQAGEP